MTIIHSYSQRPHPSDGLPLSALFKMSLPPPQTTHPSFFYIGLYGTFGAFLADDC